MRQVWWEPAERGTVPVAEEIAWVGDQLEAAVDGYTGRLLVVAKSLGTLAAARAAARGCEAAWLTPLFTGPEAARPLATYPSEQFVLIGSDDLYLSREVLDALPGTSLVVPGDHVLRVQATWELVASHERIVRFRRVAPAPAG